MRNIETVVQYSTACVPEMRRKKGVRARTSLPASPVIRKGTDPWDPPDLSQCPSVHPWHVSPSLSQLTLLQESAALPGRAVPAEQDRGALGSGEPN